MQKFFALLALASSPTLTLAQQKGATPAPAQTTAQSATGELNATRPDFTEGTDLLERGQFQLEGGVTFERSGSARTVTLGETVARYGLNKRNELRIGFPTYVSARDGGKARGLDDASLALARTLSSRLGRPLALIFTAMLPTGSRRVAERRLQAQATLATDFDLSDKADLGLSLGYGRPSDGGASFNQFYGSAELGYSLSDKVGSFAEVYGYNRSEAGGKRQQYSDFGLTYALNNNLQLDARFGLGLWNHVGGPDYFYGVGAAQRF